MSFVHPPRFSIRLPSSRGLATRGGQSPEDVPGPINRLLLLLRSLLLRALLLGSLLLHSRITSSRVSSARRVSSRRDNFRPHPYGHPSRLDRQLRSRAKQPSCHE